MRTGRWLRSIEPHSATESRERGSMPFLMIVIILTTGLSAILLTTVVSQATSARFDERRTRAVDAAQAGLDFGLARIRSAVGTDAAVGDAKRLPCSQDLPKKEAVDTVPAKRLVFDMTVDYFTDNPADVLPAVSSAKTIEEARTIAQKREEIKRGEREKWTCSTSTGPFQVDGEERVRPRYALITSTGWDREDRSQKRTLEATYVFQTNDKNYVGGQIRIYPSGASQFCMDAGQDNPPVGTPVTLQPCTSSNPPAQRQSFSYRGDLSIALVSSSPLLCVDSATSPASGVALVLKRCDAQAPEGSAALTPYNQRWSVNDNAHLEGSKSDNKTLSGLCIDAAAPQASGRQLLLRTCAEGTTDTKQTWIPSPTAGTGAAGAGNSQIVNFAQFSTCIDVTGKNVSATYLILYTCKQAPVAANVEWNQKFTQEPVPSDPSRVTLRTRRDSTNYCLASNTVYPTLVTCPSGAPQTNLRWAVSQRTRADGTDLPYAERYTIKDTSGRCLSLGSNGDFHEGAYYKLVATSCDGSRAQKWNAVASQFEATVTNTQEQSLTVTPG